jgi:flavin-dependent dehydrogenase
MDITYDAVVVGSGPGGEAVARELRRDEIGETLGPRWVNNKLQTSDNNKLNRDLQTSTPQLYLCDAP